MAVAEVTCGVSGLKIEEGERKLSFFFALQNKITTFANEKVKTADDENMFGFSPIYIYV